MAMRLLAISGLLLLSSPSQAWEQHWVAREGAIRHHIGSAGQDAIWLVGDSLTEGFWWTNLAGCPVVNLGLGGITAAALAEWMPGLSGYGTPRYSIVMIGTNTSNAAVSDVEFEAFEIHLATIVDSLAARGSKPILVSIPPIDDRLTSSEWSQSRIDKMNDTAEALAAEHSYHFIDLDPHLKDAASGRAREGVTYDGVHLTPEAYTQLRQIFDGAIAVALREDGWTCP